MGVSQVWFWFISPDQKTNREKYLNVQDNCNRRETLRKDKVEQWENMC